MRIKTLVIVVLLLMYQSIANATCETMTAEEVSQFVQTHSDEWRGMIMVSSLLSATSSEDVSLVQGTPLQVYTITEASLQNYANEGSLKSTLVQTGIWYAPISVAATEHLLEVHCHHDELSIVGTVGSQVATQLSELNSRIHFAEKSSLIVQITTTSRLFLAVDDDTTTAIYPIIEFPNQYTSLKSINELGGYAVPEVLLLITTEFLKTANVATLSADFNLTIPKTAYLGSSAAGGTEMFSVNLQYVPNPDNKFLFEVINYQPVQ